MEQLAERRMQREEDAAGAIEAESDEDSEEDGDGSERDDEGDDDVVSEDEDDDEDEEDGDEEVFIPSFFYFHYLLNWPFTFFFLGHVRRAKDGGRQTNVFYLCCTHVRTTCTASLPRESRSGTPATASPRTWWRRQDYQRSWNEKAESEPKKER